MIAAASSTPASAESGEMPVVAFESQETIAGTSSAQAPTVLPEDPDGAGKPDQEEPSQGTPPRPSESEDDDTDHDAENDTDVDTTDDEHNRPEPPDQKGNDS